MNNEAEVAIWSSALFDALELEGINLTIQQKEDAIYNAHEIVKTKYAKLFGLKDGDEK